MDAPLPVAFRSIYSQGFCRVAACTPLVAIADPATNAERTIELAKAAAERHAVLAVFPELGLSAYTANDLLFQDALLDGVETALAELVGASTGLPVLVVGAPLRRLGALYNCAVVICGGQVAGVVPKSYLPNYREFYEKRHFATHAAEGGTIRLLGHDVPFGTDLIFDAVNLAGFSLHVEICEDIWVPLPPSTLGAMAGATVLANLSASNATMGKHEYRRLLTQSQSARAISAYVYCGAGTGESTTDLVWDGHALIVENGDILVESDRFQSAPGLVMADIDLERLRQDRVRTTSFSDCALRWRDQTARFRHISLDFTPAKGDIPLERNVARFPYVPAGEPERDERCREVYSMQAAGLAQRMAGAGIRKAVIGLSGGLDSTQALLVAIKCFDRLKLPREGILAYTMPGFATSEATLGNVRDLCAALGVTLGEIDIRPACQQKLRDIGHPFAAGEQLFDATFENIQAGERASYLFRLANWHSGLVVGTSDLSEAALGYATYGVGDHMAHYQVNTSVPKTLMRHLVSWAADSGQFGQPTSDVLRKVLATAPSPELIPQQPDAAVQSAEGTVGPYVLQDFNLYYLTRFGYRPSRVAYLALQAWGDADRGAWPPSIAASDRVAYDLPTIIGWLQVFIERFFTTSQFKRSASPDGPKIGSGGSLSPRGDWRAPSDARANAWLSELRSALADPDPR